MSVETTSGVQLEENAWQQQLRRENEARIEEIAVARNWYGGSQYDALNDSAYDAIEGDKPAKLPEHLKLVAYSTQIEESVDYIAAQLAQGFQVTAENAEVQRIIDGTLSNSPDLASDDDEDEINVTTEFRDALIAGDTAVRVRWDAENELPWLEFWESEAVDFQFSKDNRFLLERVVLAQTVWELGPDGDLVEVAQEKVWELDADGECVVSTYDDGTLTTVEPTGWPFIPWRMWRGQRKKIRQARGDSIVTKRIRDLAGRYDAVEQLSFVIARYNSHGNLAVVGDSALILQQGDARIKKDVADVLTFPGGTALQTIQLPSDVQMIEHQREVCLDALFSAFGLARLDHSTVQGLGTLSGYALEILNRKTDGTFGQIGKQLARDIRSTLNLAVDVYAHSMAGQVSEDEADEPDVEVVEGPVVEEVAFDEEFMVDADAEFANRAMKIELGGGYIVDDVMLRDDYTAKLLSRRYVLRKRGLSDKDIDEIEEQIDGEAPAQPEVSLTAGAAAAAAQAVTAGTAAGQTLSNATQPEVQPEPANA